MIKYKTLHMKLLKLNINNERIFNFIDKIYKPLQILVNYD